MIRLPRRPSTLQREVTIWVAEFWYDDDPCGGLHDTAHFATSGEALAWAHDFAAQAVARGEHLDHLVVYRAVIRSGSPDHLDTEYTVLHRWDLP